MLLSVVALFSVVVPSSVNVLWSVVAIIVFCLSVFSLFALLRTLHDGKAQRDGVGGSLRPVDVDENLCPNIFHLLELA